MTKVNNTSDDIIKSTIGEEQKTYDYEIKTELNNKEEIPSEKEVIDIVEDNDNVQLEKYKKEAFSTKNRITFLSVFVSIILFLIVMFLDITGTITFFTCGIARPSEKDMIFFNILIIICVVSFVILLIMNYKSYIINYKINLLKNNDEEEKNNKQLKYSHTVNKLIIIPVLIFLFLFLSLILVMLLYKNT